MSRVNFSSCIVLQSYAPILIICILSALLLVNGSEAAAEGNDQSLVKYYYPRTESFISAPEFYSLLPRYQIIFLGELHDHEYGHLMELNVLEYMLSNHSSTKHMALSLEMFERDCQGWLTGYLGNGVKEDAFLANSRPWPNYDDAYKPLVNHAKTFKREVLASNIPRRYAHEVAIGNEKTLFQMPDVELSYMAESIDAPLSGTYWDKFYALFKDQMPYDKIVRYYRSQCLKDDTMAMSISEWWNATGNAAVTGDSSSGDKEPLQRLISVTGGFHVENFAGLYEKVGKRIPNVSRLLISLTEYDPSKPFPDVKEYNDVADVVIFMPPKPERH